ncbi:MAG TPA: cell division protein FtsL [Gammaproteobacteria bacterium]|nr:cell division protein FtsL [Gammaproteobacteria bacterium]
MNAAAKFLSQRTTSRSWVLASFFTRTQLILSMFLFTVFMSAFSIIYIANISRNLHANLHQGKYEHSRLYAQQEQLLLEQSTLGMQARIQHIAERTLNMVVPSHQSVVMIHE